VATASNFACNPHTDEVPLDLRKGPAPATLAAAPVVIVVNPAVPTTSMARFLACDHARRGTVITEANIKAD